MPCPFSGKSDCQAIQSVGSREFTTFDDQPVTSASILIKYTYNGDANLDGIINAADYFLIDSLFIGQSGKLSIGGVRLSSVPEPSVLPIAVWGMLGFIRYRRR